MACDFKADRAVGSPQPGIGVFAFTRDIGAVGASGRLESGPDGGYKLFGSGSDLWGAEDNFRFAYRATKGDGELSAHVTLGPETGREWRKAVLMFRAGLETDAAYVDAVIHENGVAALQYRPYAGAPTFSISASAHLPPFARISRKGNSFYAGFSNDGQRWETLGPIEANLPEAAFVGIGIDAFDDSRLSSASFERVELVANRIGG